MLQLPRPWALLLRVLLQQGVPPAVLWSLRQPRPSGKEEAAEEAVWGCLPAAMRSGWAASPHRMFTNEAQVGP